MRPLGIRIAVELILGVVLGVALIVVLRQRRHAAECNSRQQADAQILRLLQEALRQKDLQLASPIPIEEMPEGSTGAGLARKEAVIERLDRELAQSRAALSSLQAQLSSANDQNAKAVASSDDRLKKQEADAQAQIADLQKKLDAALAGSDIARQRAAVLEADNSKLKADTTGVTTRAADVARITGSLQDLDRRRDVYLTSILRRYRDITGEFNAMSTMLDTSHDPSSNACSGAVLSRIQNAVTATEDDLRQLNELNARTQKLEKQLAQK
jgi:hypothetical protein